MQLKNNPNMCNKKPSKSCPLRPCLPYALFSSKITQFLAYWHKHSWCYSQSCHIFRAQSPCMPPCVVSEIPLSSSVSRARERACASVALQVTHYFLAMDLLWVSSTMIMADDASAFIGTELAYQYTHVAVWGKIHAYTVYSSLMQKITEHSQYTP